MSKLLDVCKGALIGIANVIPGVSGGTMAVSLGIYNRLIVAITDLPRGWRKSLATLIPLGLGVALGIIGFTYVVEFLLRVYPLPTCLAFIGLILGGLPPLWASYRQSAERRFAASHVLLFLLFFGVSAALPVLSAAQQGGALAGGTPGLPMLFLAGVIASATMVIPGISGSMILMMLGYYYGVINLLKSFFDSLRGMDFSGVLQTALPLFCFGIGVLLGIFLIAKCIRFLLERHGAVAYSAILGLVASAPFVILYQSGALRAFSQGGGALDLVVGVAALLLFLAASLLLARISPARDRA